MSGSFQHANIVAGVLVFVVGFCFHFLGQLIAVSNRPLAIRLGIWDKETIPEYEHFEQGIAVADVLLGWIYGIAAVGLVLDKAWGYKLAWFPGVILLYHGLSFWFWTRNQRIAGHQLAFTENPNRTVWFLANVVSGLFVISTAWTAL